MSKALEGVRILDMGHVQAAPLNLKSPSGKKVLEDLIQKCDVMVENFGPGVLDRQGFTWDRIQQINPRIIYD